jgi:hypothetical protein
LRSADRDELGLAIARSLLIADQLLEESAGWLWIGGRIPDQTSRVSRGADLIARYADRLAELTEDASIVPDAGAPPNTSAAPPAAAAASPDGAAASPDGVEASPADSADPAGDSVVHGIAS